MKYKRTWCIFSHHVLLLYNYWLLRKIELVTLKSPARPLKPLGRYLTPWEIVLPSSTAQIMGRYRLARVRIPAGNHWTAGGPFIACEDRSDHFRLAVSSRRQKTDEEGKRCSEFSSRIVSYRPDPLLQGLIERLRSRRPCNAGPA